MCAKPTVAVLFGGCSSEYEVSLMSAAAIIRAVDRGRYALLTVGITREGQWLNFTGGTEDIEQDRWWRDAGCMPVVLSPNRADHGLWLFGPGGPALRHVDIVFPVLHGSNGEDGTLQGLLELAGLPFVGCGCLCSALCMDKEIAHNLALQAGIPCPEFATVYRGQGTGAAAETALNALGHLPWPWFVKPAAQGSSFGVTRAESKDGLAPALEEAFRYDEKVVVEQGIGGFEVGCSILGDARPGRPEPLVGAVDAIALQGGFFDFHEKYNLKTAQILLPAPIEDSVADAVKKTALRLYRLFGCRGLARVDLFLTGEGKIIFNEVNTIPGMTAHSRFPGMLQSAGVGFEEMVEQLLKGAMDA